MPEAHDPELADLIRFTDPDLLRDGDDPGDLILVRSPRGRLFVLRRN